MKNRPLKIALVVPTLKMGGMERVMALLADYMSSKPEVKVVLILLGTEKFYKVPSSVEIIEPAFDYKKYSRPVFTVKIFAYIFRTIRKIKPHTLLSFSERYNAFVMLAAWKSGPRVFLSDRASPFYSAGKFIDFINRYTYRLSDGIVAQTNAAAQLIRKKTKHRNICVIGNPVKVAEMAGNTEKENIILYVGRFSDQKNQHLLAQYFTAIGNMSWVVKLVGDGPKEAATRKKIDETGSAANVHFEGVQTDVGSYYRRSAIFAFTSLSEGFPNALGEAMAAGLACISFDCVAGPADLIDDGVNGFLIPPGDDSMYIEKLKWLMDDEALRISFGQKAKEKMESFNSDKIAEKFYQFITASAEENKNF